MRRIRLVERRTVVRRLPRADAAALATDWPHVVEVVPTVGRSRYRLTARGWVGTFATPVRLWEVVPKLGWEVAARLLGAGRLGDADLGRELRSALAGRLAELMAERSAAGLVRGYAERSDHSETVRGRIDFAATFQRPASGFTQTVDEFTVDQPWNGWPLAVAGRLLRGPLDPTTRTALQTAADGFTGVRPQLIPPAESADPRLAGYRPLHDWCRQVEAALDNGLLVNLERLFETYLERLLAASLAGRSVVPQRPLILRGPAGRPAVELRPDLLVVDGSGRPAAVWDVKWKPLRPTGPHPDDLHQALGYAAALGVRSAGLIYPGRRFTRVRYDTPAGATVTVATCRLTGDADRVARAADRLRRLVLRP